jgi:uncharacterized protein (DUF1501 family)
MVTRRAFMQTTGLTAGAMTLAPGWLVRAAAQSTGRRKVLVAIFQRGAADGLNVVVPYFEPRYYQLRPTIAIQRPGTANAPNIALDLDGRFGLHPQLQQLKPLWDSHQLAIVHAAGSPDPTRSHFDAQEYMESGTPGIKSDDGWLNRALPSEGENISPMRAIAISTQVPRTLKGSRGAVAVDDLPRFQLGSPAAAGIIEQLYAGSSDPRLKAQGHGTFEAVRSIESLRTRPYSPANGAVYQGEFGRRLQQIARLIKADMGVEVAFAEMGGWDHHSNENASLNNLLREFGASLAAFVRDMGDRMEDVVVVTMSEFGRTMAENGSGGTDHGHGGVMLVLGGPVSGGKVYGRWPGLEPEQLFESRDLAVTTDFRDVLGELVRNHLRQRVEHVFPGYAMPEPHGLLKV